MSVKELPEGWHSIRLGDLIDYGKAEKIEPFEIADDTWVLELEDIQKDSSKILERHTFSKRKSKSSKNKFKKGDVLYGKLRPYLNKVVIADNDGVCTTEIVPINGGDFLDNKFLFFWLKSYKFHEYVIHVSRGVNMPRLGTNDGLNAPLIYTALFEQKQIASLLDKHLAQVEQIKSRLDAIPVLLKKFRQSVLADAVSGKLTEEWRKDATTSDWENSTIGDISVVKTGKTPSRKEAKYWENGKVPWLTSSATGNDYCYETEEFISEVASIECNLKPFPKGSLLLAMYGEGKTRGQVTELMIEATCNQACAVIIPDQARVHVKFVKLRLQENYEIIRKAASGGNQPNLNLNKVREIEISTPSLEEQAQIILCVEQLFAYADQIEQRILDAQKRVNNLTQAILAKAFSGELTAEWRKRNPELISGENSAAALLQRIETEEIKPVKRGRK